MIRSRLPCQKVAFLLFGFLKMNVMPVVNPYVYKPENLPDLESDLMIRDQDYARHRPSFDMGNCMCLCDDRYTGVDCSTKVCDEQCSIHGGVCDNGKCEFRCSDYAGNTCRNSSALLYTLSVCQDVLETEHSGQHCAPSEPSVLQQLEEVVVMPNYHRLFPGGARKLINSLFHKQFDCDAAAKKLACWISIQKCDRDGDNRLQVCHSACQSYNKACGASLDCLDLTLFSGENERNNQCTGYDETVRSRGLVSPGKSSRSLDAIKQMLVMYR